MGGKVRKLIHCCSDGGREWVLNGAIWGLCGRMGAEPCGTGQRVEVLGCREGSEQSSWALASCKFSRYPSHYTATSI